MVQIILPLPKQKLRKLPKIIKNMTIWLNMSHFKGTKNWRATL